MRIGEQDVNLFEEDVFLASYPKSGNTWIRFLIGNYLTGNKCDFSNSHFIVPDIHYNPEQIEKLEPTRFIKTHHPFNPSYKKIVYIVRDVRDVAVSYFFYALKFKIIDKETDFRKFLIDIFDNGIIDGFSDWSNHVNSYMKNDDGNLLLVKYEDLTEDTVREFTRIVEFSQIPLRQEDILSAVEASKFSEMQKLEKIQVDLFERFKNSDQSIKFIRKGKVGAWQDWFDDDLLSHIIGKHGEVMQRLGYIPSQFFSLNKNFIDLKEKILIARKPLSDNEGKIVSIEEVKKEIDFQKANLEDIKCQLSNAQINFSSAQRKILSFEEEFKAASEEQSRLISEISHLETQNDQLRGKVEKIRNRNLRLANRNKESRHKLRELRISGRRALDEKQLVINELSSALDSFRSSKLWKLHSRWVGIKRKLLTFISNIK